jgi:hypothetical protein
MAHLYLRVTLSIHKHLQLTFLTEFEMVSISIKGLFVTRIKSNHSSISFENLYNFVKV